MQAVLEKVEKIGFKDFWGAIGWKVETEDLFIGESVLNGGA